MNGALPQRIDSATHDPVIDIVLIETDILADLVEGDTSLANEPANEAFGRAQALGELTDAEHRTLDSAPPDSGLSDHGVLLRVVVAVDVESMSLRIRSA
jgi:hypothetical protein